MRITEVKRHLDGSAHRFDCELVLRRRHVVVVRFEHWENRSAGGFSVPRGSRTDGFFWRRRPYSLYRMAGPDGRRIADRYDIVDGVRFGRDEVSYLDLLLDIWIAPDGRVRVEDEDEVEEAVRAGKLSRADRRRILAARDLVLRRHPTVVREAARLLAEARS